MRRSIDQALLDLRQHLLDWKRSGAKPGVKMLVYPPEWEALMLARLPVFAQEMAPLCPLEVVDVGQGFLGEVEGRKGFIDRLVGVEARGDGRLLHDLGEVAQRYLQRVLATPPDPPGMARLLVNLGALGAFVSYSTLTNALDEVASADQVAVPTVLAFPGEGDERSLNLMRLRADTNYRVPRI